MYYILIADIVLTLILIGGIVLFVTYICPHKMLETQLKLLSVLTNVKDLYTESHSTHVGVLCGLIYKQLPKDVKSSVSKRKLIRAANLHDIGKLYVPDEILNKVDALTDNEREIIKLHAQVGAKVLERTAYRDIAHIVALHHERVDGCGYYGIHDAQIPIESKIIAIADTFSSLTTDRTYRKGITIISALNVIKECAGTQLDKSLVNCFLSIDIGKLIAADTMIKGQYFIS